MAVDRERVVRPLPNLPRAVALRAYGVVRLLDSIQGGFEDIEGAVAARQYGVAAFQGRYVVLACLSVRSLAREGELDFEEEALSFDPFAGLSAEEIDAGMRLADDGLELDDETAAAWLDRVRDYVAETERLLGYDHPIPTLRSPDGSFALLGLTRRWTPILRAYGWPDLMSGDFFQTSGS